MRGNAKSSTLRLTLGCILCDQLQIELRRVSSGTRMTFAEGEYALSAWMTENARVVWAETAEPWLAEAKLIQELSLPLNLDQNSAHPFHERLSSFRRLAKKRARSLPVVKAG